MIRVLIIEDEIIIARFIEKQLKVNFECDSAIAVNAEEVMAIIPGFVPHLILCDINLQEERDGLALIEELRRQYVFEVIFITSYQSKPIIEKALLHRPLNYMIKPLDEAAIFACLKLAWATVTANDNPGRSDIDDQAYQQLSNIERKIIQLILQNKTSREIADALFLSPYTIKNHRHNICRKLGLKNGNNALLQWAMLHKDLRKP